MTTNAAHKIARALCRADDRHRQAQQIAARFIERSEATGLKGKRRDDAAIDYFCGAAAAAEITGQTELAETLGRVVALIIAFRGYQGVKELAEIKEPTP